MNFLSSQQIRSLMTDLQITQNIEKNGILEINGDEIKDINIFFEVLEEFIKKHELPFPTKKFYDMDINKKFLQLVEYQPITSKNSYRYNSLGRRSELTKDDRFFDGTSWKWMSFLSRDDDYDIDQLTDYFTEVPRMEGRRSDRNISPMERWHNSIDLFKKVFQEKKIISSKEVRELIWKEKIECTSFKITLAFSIYQFFDRDRILDISAGWGDRLLSAIAYGKTKDKSVVTYTGFDPNLRLKPGHDQIIQTFGDENYKVIYEPFETNTYILDKKYDIVFTSPPYFNLEIYDDSENQSVNKYQGFSSWLRNFLLKSVAHAWSSLDDDGVLALHIIDVKGNKIVEPLILYILGYLPNSMYAGQISSVGFSKESRPIWIFYKVNVENSKVAQQARSDLSRLFNIKY